LKKSLIHGAGLDDVRREYETSSIEASDFEKMKWGSHESMVNRFDLARRIVDWPRVARWLDIGCGTGLFFEFMESNGQTFDELVGIDVAPSMIAQANARKLRSPANFAVSQAGTPDPAFRGRFQLVTLIGVLQKCGSEPEAFLTQALDCLTDDGQLFLTTKHLGWRAFERDGLTPEPNHSWFDADDLADAVRHAGGAIVTHGGFLPHENQQVPLADSHTQFILATRG
jgi:2-polyprenyl-3-methyl-5-hydroxy-6-metoxy-1,4-benzoquinol methylase